MRCLSENDSLRRNWSQSAVDYWLGIFRSRHAAALPRARVIPLVLCSLISLGIAIVWILAMNPANVKLQDIWIWPCTGLVAACTSVSLLLAWLLTPRIHRHGNYFVSLFHSWKINSVFFPWVTGGIIANTAIYVFALAARDTLVARTSPNSISSFIQVEFVTVAGSIACGFLYLRHASRATRRFADSIPPPQLPIICEICGYELMAGDQTTRCPECGQPPLPPRRTSDWEIRPTFASWWRCAHQALLRPGSYYRSLSLAGSLESTEGFAARNFRLMVPLAAAWILSMAVYGDRPVHENFMLAIIPALAGGLAVALVGWVLTRTLAALAVSVCIVCGVIRDGRAFAVAFDYETPFIWTFCLFNGLYFTSLMLTSQNTWISQLQQAFLGHQRPIFGIPVEPLGLFVGNAFLILSWLIRYRTIVRAIRWSNVPLAPKDKKPRETP